MECYEDSYRLCYVRGPEGNCRTPFMGSPDAKLIGSKRSVWEDFERRMWGAGSGPIDVLGTVAEGVRRCDGWVRGRADAEGLERGM